MQHAVGPAELEGLVDQLDLGADRQAREEGLDVLGQHADAAVGDPHADALGAVGAVDQVAGNAQAHLELAQGVVRSRGHHVRQRPSVLGMFLDDRLRRIPGRILDLLGDPGLAQRRLPVHASHGDGVGLDARRLALFGGRVVVEAHLGHVDHYALARALGEDEAARDHHLGALEGRPDADVGVGANHLLVADAVLVTNVDQGVFLVGDDGVDLADEITLFGEGVVAARPVGGIGLQGCGQGGEEPQCGSESGREPERGKVRHRVVSRGYRSSGGCDGPVLGALAYSIARLGGRVPDGAGGSVSAHPPAVSSIRPLRPCG